MRDVESFLDVGLGELWTDGQTDGKKYRYGASAGDRCAHRKPQRRGEQGQLCAVPKRRPDAGGNFMMREEAST